MDIALILGLGLSAFLAGSVLPLPSEAALAAAILAAPEQIGLLVIVASLGNILGALTNWWLGHWAEHFKDRAWFPVSKAKLMAAQKRYQRYGIASLLLAWVPIIGDPLTIVAGFMRVSIWVFLPMVGLAKIGRYIVVALSIG